MPYDTRPVELPLDIEECRTAIWRSAGNITEAAAYLKIPSKRLRAFVKASKYLSAELAEAGEQIKDIAESVVLDALTDEDDKQRRDSMAKFVLTGPGKDRGYGSNNGGVKVNVAGDAKFEIAWGDGTKIGPAPPTIEGEVNR